MTVKRITGVESVSNDGISVRTLGKRIYVDGAEGRTLNIYNAAGFLMASFDIDSSDYIVELNVNAGIYIAEIDGVATKVILH